MLGNLFSMFRPNGTGQGFSPFGMMNGMASQPPEPEKPICYPLVNPKTMYIRIFLWVAAGLALSTISGFALSAVLNPANLIGSLAAGEIMPTFRFMWFMPIFVVIQLVLGIGCSFFLRKMNYKGGKTKSTRLVESGEVAKSLCYSRMRAIFSS